MSFPVVNIGFNHGVLGLAENPARGTGFWSQNTEGVARGVLTEKARPEGWVFSQAQHPMIKTYYSMFLHCNTTIITGDPLHSRAACTQPCNVNTHSRAHCSPGARLCSQWGHGCVNNGARLCASARLCRGSPVIIVFKLLAIVKWKRQRADISSRHRC